MLEYDYRFGIITPAQVDAFVKAKDKLRIEPFGEASVSSDDPNLRNIISIGAPVIPLILEELKAGPSWLFAALQEITGENPIQESGAESIEDFNRAWLRWGEKNGYTNLEEEIVFSPLPKSA